MIVIGKNASFNLDVQFGITVECHNGVQLCVKTDECYSFLEFGYETEELAEKEYKEMFEAYWRKDEMYAIKYSINQNFEINKGE